jgi:Ni/Co efflux regulator RcnB
MQQAASRSGESDMTASDAESWARLRLVQGESSAQKWELVSALGHTTLTVGSNPDCAWVVQEEGVRPIHFSLHWDGSTLRVADVYSAGDVRVDGALLTSQWRPLLGRVRIDFGKAAIVVETSASSQGRWDVAATQPVSEPRRPSSSAPRGGKETLIGVMPSQSGGPASSLPPRAAPVVADEVRASTKNLGSMKATLVGGIGVAGLGIDARGPAAQVVSGPGAKPNATLVGFSPADALRGVVGTQPAVTIGNPQGGASLSEPDQRTVQGFPVTGKSGSSAPPPHSHSSVPAGRRATVQGMVSQPPGVVRDAVAQVPVRPISSPPSGQAPQERIQSAWQETAESRAARGGNTVRGVQEPLDGPESEPEARAGSPSQWDMGDRMSDIPTRMRDPATFEMRRPQRGFPWRYVGVLTLTAVAYFAWLYLLDHM